MVGENSGRVDCALLTGIDDANPVFGEGYCVPYFLNIIMPVKVVLIDHCCFLSYTIELLKDHVVRMVRS